MNIVGKFVLKDGLYVKCMLCGREISRLKSPVVLSGIIADHLYEHVHEYDRKFILVSFGFVYIRRFYSGAGYNVNIHFESMAFPMLIFLLPVDAREFAQRSRNVHHEAAHNFDENMVELIMKTNYMCVKCRNYYESGLPSLEVVSRHVMSCLKFFAEQKTSQHGE